MMGWQPKWRRWISIFHPRGLREKALFVTCTQKLVTFCLFPRGCVVPGTVVAGLSSGNKNSVPPSMMATWTLRRTLMFCLAHWCRTQRLWVVWWKTATDNSWHFFQCCFHNFSTQKLSNITVFSIFSTNYLWIVERKWTLWETSYLWGLVCSWWKKRSVMCSVEFQLNFSPHFLGFNRACWNITAFWSIFLFLN